MTKDERDDMEDALFAPAELGRSDYVCPRPTCPIVLHDVPVLACDCGCQHPLDRLCPKCQTIMQAVRVQ